MFGPKERGRITREPHSRGKGRGVLRYIQRNTDFSKLLGKLNLVRKIGAKNLTEAIQGSQLLVRRIGSLREIEGSNNQDSTVYSYWLLLQYSASASYTDVKKKVYKKCIKPTL